MIKFLCSFLLRSFFHQVAKHLFYCTLPSLPIPTVTTYLILGLLPCGAFAFPFPPTPTFFSPFFNIAFSPTTLQPAIESFILNQHLYHFWLDCTSGISLGKITRNGYHCDGLRGSQRRPIRRFVTQLQARTSTRLFFKSAFLPITTCTSHRLQLPIFRLLHLGRVLIDALLQTANRPLDEAPRYERDNRSASPRPRDDNEGGRRRSASPGGHGDRLVLMMASYS